MGKWFGANPEKRPNIFLATKFGFRATPTGIAIDSTPEYVKEACSNSLKRLGLSYIDLYYCHRLDEKTPIEKTVQAMAELKLAGKIKYLGLSEVTAESLKRAHKVHPITAVQMEYSPFALEIESPQYKLMETCRELGVAIVAYSPIGRGMLSGNFRSHEDFEDGDFRKYAPRFSKENFYKNLELVDKIVAIANKKAVSSSQLTLAWLLVQGDDIFPIPGTTKEERLVENIESLDIKLTTEENQDIRKAAEEAEILGGRYPEAFSQSLFADTPPLEG